MERVKCSIAVVYSVNDLAGSGAAKYLKEFLGKGFIREVGGGQFYVRGDVVLTGFEENVLFFDFLDELFDVGEAYIVLSKHRSVAGVKSLTVHHPGNPGPEALYGGRPRELAYAYPRLQKTLLKNLHEVAVEKGLVGEYDVVLEVTHHGPTSLSKPVLFIEIGSSEEEWRDERARETLALAVARTLEEYKSAKCRPVIGFGGQHYARKHTRHMLESNDAYGHILAKYILDLVDDSVYRQAVEKSVEKPVAIIVEKKSVKGRHKAAAKRLSEMYGLEVEYI